MLSVVKMLLKGEVGGCALNSHGNYTWKNHGIVYLNFCGNPVGCMITRFKLILSRSNTNSHPNPKFMNNMSETHA